MKSLIKLVGLILIMAFFAFVWLSHTGTLSGTGSGHFFGGVGFLVLGVFGFALLINIDAHFPLWFTGLTSIVSAIAYIGLKSAGLIGPVLSGTRPEDVGLASVMLGILYVLIAGIFTGTIYDIYRKR